MGYVQSQLILWLVGVIEGMIVLYISEFRLQPEGQASRIPGDARVAPEVAVTLREGEAQQADLIRTLEAQIQTLLADREARQGTLLRDTRAARAHSQYIQYSGRHP